MNPKDTRRKTVQYVREWYNQCVREGKQISNTEGLKEGVDYFGHDDWRTHLSAGALVVEVQNYAQEHVSVATVLSAVVRLGIGTRTVRKIRRYLSAEIYVVESKVFIRFLQAPLTPLV